MAAEEDGGGGSPWAVCCSRSDDEDDEEGRVEGWGREVGGAAGSEGAAGRGHEEEDERRGRRGCMQVKEEACRWSHLCLCTQVIVVSFFCLVLVYRCCLCGRKITCV